MSPRLALTGLTPEALVLRVPALELGEARRVVATVHAGGDFSAPDPGVRRSARAAVAAVATVPELRLEQQRASGQDGFVKWVLRTGDERLIETVRIPLERAGRFSVCVSSQVGCALACAFCATGRLGLGRNLETWEIVEQVRHVRRGLDASAGERVHGVVFQGMGEPLANWERVFAAVRVLSDPNALAIDQRRITISTAGLPGAMLRLGRELPNVRLAWSLGSARPALRARLMPIEHAHPLEDCYAACVEHARATGRSPLWAVTLLGGVNDSDEDAEALAALAQRFASDAGRSARISVIPYNRIGVEGSDPFQPASDAAEARFRERLHARGVFAHRRYSGGADIAAACGQLAARRARAQGSGSTPSLCTIQRPSFGKPGCCPTAPSQPAAIKATASSRPPLDGK